MPKNFDVLTIYFCHCFFKPVLYCVFDQRLVKSNDMMLSLTTNVTGKVLINILKSIVTFVFLFGSSVF